MPETGTAAAVEINDEFTLKPGELTKEQAAERYGCSPRNIEIMKSQGKLAGEKVRRRVEGVVKQVLIFHEEDIDRLKEPVRIATVEQQVQETGLQLHQEAQRGQIQAMAMLGKALGLGDDRKPFIPIDQAADEYELSPAGLRRMIADKLITAYPGKNGRTMVSRKQLEAL